MARSITSPGSPASRGDLDAVGMGCPTRYDLSQKNNLVVPLLDRNVVVFDPVAGDGQFRQARDNG